MKLYPVLQNVLKFLNLHGNLYVLNKVCFVFIKPVLPENVDLRHTLQAA